MRVATNERQSRRMPSERGRADVNRNPTRSEGKDRRTARQGFERKRNAQNPTILYMKIKQVVQKNAQYIRSNQSHSQAHKKYTSKPALFSVTITFPSRYHKDKVKTLSYLRGRQPITGARTVNTRQGGLQYEWAC